MNTSEQVWPERIWLVRHGQSAGNVAHEAALRAGHALIDVDARDMDVPLSPLGERQAEALGAHFASAAESDRPNVILSSPYLRARQTAEAVGKTIRPAPSVQRVDERLREKELGLLNRLTKTGIIERFPQEAELRSQIGKFYYRPPGGESWCDVLLRLRSVLDHMQLQYRGERVLIVAHQVVVLCFRYLLEELDEERVLAIDREKDVANCAITSYRFDRRRGPSGSVVLEQYNVVDHLREAGEPVTQKPDQTVGVR